MIKRIGRRTARLHGNAAGERHRTDTIGDVSLLDPDGESVELSDLAAGRPLLVQVLRYYG